MTERSGKPLRTESIYKGQSQKKMKTFYQAFSDRTRGKVFKLKEVNFRLDVRNVILYYEGGGRLEQRSCGCPIHGSAGQRFE